MALTTNLVAYYKLDESSGNAADSVGSNTATNSNATFASGKINNGASFNGSSSKFTLSSLPFSGNSKFTVSCWVKVAATAANIIWYFGNTATKQSVGIAYEYNGGSPRLDYFYFGGNYFYSTTLTIGTWYHVVVVYDQANYYLYFNGSLVATNALTSLNISAGTTRIGVDIADNAGTWWNGMIDEFAVWTRDLSGAEITTLYNSGNGMQYPFNSAYTQSVVESITVADGYIKANTKSIIEAITASEVVAASRVTIKNIAESVVLTEVIANVRSTYKAIVEAITVTEVLVHAITKSVLENITTSDTIAGIKVIIGAVTESITVSDAYSYARGYALTILEAITIADAKTIAFTKVIIDSVTISEALNATRLYFKSIIESATIGELITTTSVRAIHIYESIRVREAPAAARNGLAISLRYFKKYAAKVKTFAKKYIIYP